MRTNIRKSPVIFFAACLFTVVSNAQVTDSTINAWKINTGGLKGQSADSAIHNQVSAIDADVQHVHYNDSDAYIESTGIPSHFIGPFNDGNPAVPSDQGYLFRIPRTRPEPAANPEATGLGAIGLFVNGVAMYNFSDARTYEDQGIWEENAVFVIGFGDGWDSGNGHPAPPTPPGGPGPAPRASVQQDIGAKRSRVQHQVSHNDNMPHSHNAFSQESQVLAGAYHYHQNPALLREQLKDDGSIHSPILGFVFDGVPLYGPYGYANQDGTGGVARIHSSYRLRDISVRDTLSDGTSLPSGQRGPPVNEEYPLGYYIEDFEYVDGLGYLDEFNGRFSVTPEYPNGVYAYYATIDENGNGAFPYLLGPDYYASPLQDNLAGSVVLPGDTQQYIPTSAVTNWELLE